jgi:hypothetical protein
MKTRLRVIIHPPWKDDVKPTYSVRDMYGMQGWHGGYNLDKAVRNYFEKRDMIMSQMPPKPMTEHPVQHATKGCLI